jgi:hypothetical protein
MKALTQPIDLILVSLRGVPGVEAASTSASVPGTSYQVRSELKVSGAPTSAERRIVVDVRFVSAGYFATMRIPLLAGEPCRESHENTVVVNRVFTETYLAGGPAIGRSIEFANAGIYSPPHAEIRGIVADAREQGLDREPAPTVYYCFSAPDPTPVYLVRTHGAPMAMAETLRRKIYEIEPARSVFDVIPLTGHLDDAFAENRLRTILLTFFAVTAVSLACLGLYGTLSYFLSIRRREVGLRLALGALRGQIMRQFLSCGFRASLLGAAAGLCLAAACSRTLSGMLFGISSWDATTFIGVLVLVLFTGALSSLLPAIRAARLDPMQALREE